ncbi:hypothetical protein FHS43_005980 [Streptosporangium becharense]|uniref:Uncharacterized protein n=1 Tax=Streptosporangium becharense TaxID=1816182 RepID=A0A7W9MHU1_9ACTN|nr:hypothetical protein [Streptosporangium becharense]MBB2914668.1 hypothetical protein [Streptosporangium becharense]MBB5820931.1 hypothetical protein [Streptosporangium becharense]
MTERIPSGDGEAPEGAGGTPARTHRTSGGQRTRRTRPDGAPGGGGLGGGALDGGGSGGGGSGGGALDGGGLDGGASGGGAPAGQAVTSLVVTAVIGAVGWAALAAESFAGPPPQNYRDALILVPWTMYAVLLVGIHRLQRHRTGRVAVVGLVTIMVGMVVSVVGTLGAVLGNASMEAVAFPGGPGLFLLGLVVFGAVTVHAGVLPAWTGVLIALSQVLAALIGVVLSWRVPLHSHGSYTGGIGFGLTMAALAFALHRYGRDPAPSGRNQDPSGSRRAPSSGR